jgi:hypothetical protein
MIIRFSEDLIYESPGDADYFDRSRYRNLFTKV